MPVVKRLPQSVQQTPVTTQSQMCIQITCAFGETRVVLDRSAAQFWAVLTTCRLGPHVPDGPEWPTPARSPPSSLTFQDADAGQPGAVRIEPPDSPGTSCSLQSWDCFLQDASQSRQGHRSGPRAGGATAELRTVHTGSHKRAGRESILTLLELPFSGLHA